MDIINMEDIRTRRSFNQYYISYNNLYTIRGLKERVIIETAFQTVGYPYERRLAQSLIGEYFDIRGRTDYINQYDLDELEVTVQCIERTFIDKVFAVADYYLNDRIEEHSRHLYDLYKLFSHIHFDQEFYMLLKKVQFDRQKLKYCSSSDDINNLILTLEIIVKKISMKKIIRIQLIICAMITLLIKKR